MGPSTDFTSPSPCSPQVLARTPESDIVELTCSAAWFINRGVLGGNPDTEIYAEEWARATAFRAR